MTGAMTNSMNGVVRLLQEKHLVRTKNLGKQLFMSGGLTHFYYFSKGLGVGKCVSKETLKSELDFNLGFIYRNSPSNINSNARKLIFNHTNKLKIIQTDNKIQLIQMRFG